ncbi:hypothetical protein C8R44DRAFT_985139 [Mycena epipterygia]|nr:hypothetical protein C8R44DRAFT_985139 [Mycena epipterygia]
MVKSTGRVDLEFLDGSTLTDIDAVVCGTIRARPPATCRTFKHTPNTHPPLTSEHISPPQVPSLYNHILYAPTPTVALIGAVMSYMLFMFVDVASTWFTLFLDERLPIPNVLDV